MEQGLKTGPYFSQMNYCIIPTPSLPQGISKTEQRGTKKGLRKYLAYKCECLYVCESNHRCAHRLTWKLTYIFVHTGICACRTPIDKYFLPFYTSWNYIACGEGEPMQNQPTDFFFFFKSAWKLVRMGFPEALILELLHIQLMGPIYLWISLGLKFAWQSFLQSLL